MTSAHERIASWVFVVAVGLFGWYGNNGYRYVTNLYKEARLCEATQCESIKEMAETMGQPPILTKEKKK